MKREAIVVASHIKKYGALPEYYISKEAAR